MKPLPTLILSLIVSVGMAGCKGNKGQITKQIPNSAHGETYKIVTIDGCQYIIYYGSYTAENTVMIHKGNCKNPIHKK